MHPQQSKIKNKNFAVRILDKDTNSKLVIREENLSSKDQINYLIKFINKGSWEIIEHSNYQKRFSKNYEFQVVYLYKGQEYLLDNGTFPLIVDSEIVDY